MIKELQRMAIFAKVVEQGSFSAAAKSLGLGKSVVSQHIQALERNLGVQLLNRSTRSLSLTEAGRGFYQPCLRIVQEAESAQQDVVAQERTPRGKIRMTASYNLSLHLLIPLLNKYRQRNPEVTIDLVLEDSIVNVIEDGYDVAFRTGWLADSSLPAVALTTFDMPLVASPLYLERRSMPFAPEDLVAHDWVAITVLPQFEKITLEHDDGRRRTIKITPTVAVNSGIAAKEFLLAGVGIGLVPDYAVKAELQSGRLVRVLPDWRSRSGTVSIVYPHKHLMSSKTRSLIDFMKAEFRSGDKPPHAFPKTGRNARRR